MFKNLHRQLFKSQYCLKPFSFNKNKKVQDYNLKNIVNQLQLEKDKPEIAIETNEKRKGDRGEAVRMRFSLSDAFSEPREIQDLEEGMRFQPKDCVFSLVFVFKIYIQYYLTVNVDLPVPWINIG